MKSLTQKLATEYDDESYSEDDEPKYHGREAAGCIFISKSTGRILLAKRTENTDPQYEVMEPGTWGTWGGKIDEGENPKQAVVREVEEETGYDGDYKLSYLWTFEDHEVGFQYHNYVVIVAQEFTPKLNWENDNSKWVEWGEWPSPMHFGLKALLKNSGDKIRRIIRLIKKKKAGIIEAMDAAPPPAIVRQMTNPATAPKNVRNIVDGYVVAATLWGEARGEGKIGMQAVMNVIVNRSHGNSKEFKGVVLKHKQFSFWNGVPNPEEKAMAFAASNRNDPLWKQCVQLVDLAYDGKLPDITDGALFYFNPKLAKPSWANSMVKTKTIGHHEFYKPAPTVKLKKNQKPKAALREMIESKNSSAAIVSKTGICGVGIYEYEMRSPFSVIRYRMDTANKIFYLDSIATPLMEHRGQGHATSVLESFFQLIKQYRGALDCDTYTTSGMAHIKPAVQKFAKSYGIRLLQGATND